MRNAYEYFRGVVRSLDLGHAPKIPLSAATACYLLFTLITIDVVMDGPLRQLDDVVAGQSWQRVSAPLNNVAYWLDKIGQRGVTAPLLLLTAVVISRRIGWWRPFRLALLAFVSLNVSVGAVKVLMGRTSPRSGVDEILSGGFFYVSGHAANAALSWGLIAYLIHRFTTVSQRVKNGAIAGAGAAALVMCVVSLYRNTHWITDLVGGVLVGWTLLGLIIVVDHMIVRNPLIKPSDEAQPARIPA